MTTFYLVRHAHAQWAPDEMRSLSARGRADARRVADILIRYPVNLIVASPYNRARETVTPLATPLGLPVYIQPDLRERRLSGNPVSAETFTAAVRATWQDPTFAHPGGEPNAAAQQRGVAVVTMLQTTHPGASIVVGTHGNLLALILQHFDPTIDFNLWRRLTMPDIYRLHLDPGTPPAISRLWQDEQ
ncbi:MAG: histidine phosphatase family protein [Anaerolineae bacterium]